MERGWEDHGRILLFILVALLDLLGFASIRGQVEDSYIPYFSQGCLKIENRAGTKPHNRDEWSSTAQHTDWGREQSSRFLRMLETIRACQWGYDGIVASFLYS